MRLTNTILALVAFASLAGCAAPAASIRGPETAIRAEPRQMSFESGRPEAVLIPVSGVRRPL